MYRNDMRQVILFLAHATSEDINAPISQRDLRRPLHIACSVMCLPIVQLLLWVSIPLILIYFYFFFIF